MRDPVILWLCFVVVLFKPCGLTVLMSYCIAKVLSWVFIPQCSFINFSPIIEKAVVGFILDCCGVLHAL